MMLFVQVDMDALGEELRDEYLKKLYGKCKQYGIEGIMLTEHHNDGENAESAVIK